MANTHHTAGGGWRNRSKVALACAVVSVTALLPVACGLPGGEDADAAAPPAASAAPKVDDAAAAKQALADFQAASAALDAAKVEASLSESSKTYYENLRKLALTANKATLAKKRLVDQVTVLGLRAGVKPDVLRDGDVTQLIEATLKSQQGAGPGTDDLSKAEVAVSGDTATVTDPELPDAALQLVREDGAWKVDVRSVFDMVDGLLTQLSSMHSGGKTGFVEQTVAQQVGGAAKARKLWKPVGAGD